MIDCLIDLTSSFCLCGSIDWLIGLIMRSVRVSDWLIDWMLLHCGFCFLLCIYEVFCPFRWFYSRPRCRRTCWKSPRASCATPSRFWWRRRNWRWRVFGSSTLTWRRRLVLFCQFFLLTLHFLFQIVLFWFELINGKLFRVIVGLEVRHAVRSVPDPLHCPIYYFLQHPAKGGLFDEADVGQGSHRQQHGMNLWWCHGVEEKL